MINIQTFVFNPFQENTYVLSDDSGECVIIDPGCYEQREKDELEGYIAGRKLKPVRLINTHGHIDHILGNNFVASAYGLDLEMNDGDLSAVKAAPEYGLSMGISAEPSPAPARNLREGDAVTFGAASLDVVETPGHSPGSICLVSPAERFVIGGDVLFYGSVGRTDLPGGDHETLMASIRDKLYRLDDDFAVYPGHGPATTIGFEKKNNQFCRL